jgi:hypothetical protein
VGLLKIPIIFAFVCVLLLLPPIDVNAQQAVIDDIRKQAEKELGPNRLGAFYAATINFAVNPDISTATYHVQDENLGDPTISVFRLPLRYVSNIDGSGFRPFVQAGFAYQTIESSFDLLDSESIDTEWRAYGGSIAIGLEMPIGKRLKIMPVIDGGLVRLENDAEYNGTVSNLVLKPAFEGLVFDWEADAWLMGASLGIDYRRRFKRVDFNFHGSLTHNYIETYDSSSGLIEFDSQVTTFDINTDTVVPTGMSISVFPLAAVVTVGYTTFLGPDRDELGFEYFFEGGLALEMDVSEKDWMLQNFRLGGKGIYGEDVTGWSLILGYRF